MYKKGKEEEKEEGKDEGKDEEQGLGFYGIVFLKHSLIECFFSFDLGNRLDR